ncbi:MAG: hypothetical protein JXX29_08840 [Deltaproteobacteria bacterium]|nr:hypothetical protein [Deltaproteobacteria bacterium]MBN2671767.1 hypothetical protein [Deltaproteobacteria bacterium]
MTTAQKIGVFFTLFTTVFCTSIFADTSYRKWCAKWPTKFIDGGYGEDTFTAQDTYEYTPAKFAQARIRITGEPYHFEGYLDADGCTPALLTETDTSYEFNIWYTRYRNGRNIYINAEEFAPSPAYKSKTILIGGIASTSNVNATYTAWNSRTNLAQLAGLALNYYSSRNWPSASVTYISTDDNPNCAVDGGTWAHENFICINTDYVTSDSSHYDHARYKFVVAHEMGHRQAQGVGGVGGHDTIDYSPRWPTYTEESPCNCIRNTGDPATAPGFCFRARMDVQTAAGEGWANFYAAALLNDRSSSNGYMAIWNNTYKLVYIFAIWDSTPPIQYNMLSRERWMESFCEENMPNKGIMGDWSQFFWELWTLGSYNMDIAAISAIWDTNYDDYHTAGTEGQWGTLVDTVDDLMTNDYVLNFQNKGDATGVNH